MGYTLGDLNREIASKIDAYGAESGIEKQELISEVMSEHSEIEGDDSEFALVCSQEAVRVHVEKAFNRIKQKETADDDAQGKLPGFEHIQQRYIVEDADGKRIAINVNAMTSDQLSGKCKQLSGMGLGLLAHARELQRYAEETGRGW